MTGPESAQLDARSLSAVLEHVRDVVVLAQPDGTVRWSPTPAWAPGAPLVEGIHPEDRSLVASALEAVAASHGARRHLDVRIRARVGTDHQGGPEWGRADFIVVNRLDQPGLEAMVITVRDTTSQDSLTALPDRATLLDQLSRVTGLGRACAVLYLDLDGFKPVNDQLGHAAGDRLLINVADRLRRAVRPGDIVARLGGDEFVVVAEGVDKPGDALEIAQRIRTVVGRPIALAGRIVNVTASIGVTVGYERDASSLLERADSAMYQAKQAGRNRCELYHEAMVMPSDARHDVEDLLGQALDRGGLIVMYQPIVELATGRRAAVEALLRIGSGKGELLTPAGFLRVAEETGLIVSVGAGMLDVAAQQVLQWTHERGADVAPCLSVNVSGRQLAEPHMAEQILGTLRRYELAPSQLCLELAESVLIDAGPATRRTLEELKELGVVLAVDDFGTGRSSLAYLRRFAIDALKIERRFLTGLGYDDGDTEVIKAVIGLGQALGLTTIAKGVETAEQAEMLRELGCQQAQGFYFGRPSRPEDLVTPVG